MLLALRIQPPLQDDDCGCLVQYTLPLRPSWKPLRIQQLLCRMRGEPFIPQVHRHTAVLAHRLRKLLHTPCLGTYLSRHVQWIAHHNGNRTMFPRKARHVFGVLSGIRAPRSHQRARDAHCIGDRHANPPLSHVKAQNAPLFLHLTSISVPQGAHRRRKQQDSKDT